MKEFKSIEKSHITGRGDVFTVKVKDLDNLLGDKVLIDNVEYLVRGVQTMGILKIGDRVGLLV